MTSSKRNQNNWKLIGALCLLTVLFTLSGCKKYLDINVDPNRPTEAPINGLLAATTQNTGLNVFRVANAGPNYYVQYFASPNASSPTDIYDRVDFSGLWRSLYDNMTDIYDLEQLSIRLNSSAHLGMAKVMMALNLSMATNLWGSVPYSEAFKGDNLNPKFDDAQQLHTTCINLLDEGIAELRKIPTVAVTPAADFLHGPTAANANAWNNTNRIWWIRTAFALKARLLNQLSKSSNYNAGSVLSAVDSAYTNNNMEARVTIFTLRNPWATVARNQQSLVLDGWLSTQFVNNAMAANSVNQDPRLPRITNLTRFNDYRGTRNGAGRIGTGTTNDECYLVLAGFYSGDASPLFVATFEETKFIEAEAALRAGNRTRAYNAYLAAITANMNKLGVPATQRDAYLARPNIAMGSLSLQLADIFREKYIALFLSPVTFDDARRIDFSYTGFQLPVNAVLPSPIRRLDYPSSEQTRNRNTPTVGNLNERLWWDR
ncbi:MAG: SusD/RagB family nutrient-binding outer membrane lipoprotein [Hydrotalea sp.]|nr:SusD/RagB family nutrient-binding outer membrane lipoprotein [Hydrotalea sp.]